MPVARSLRRTPFRTALVSGVAVLTAVGIAPAAGAAGSPGASPAQSVAPARIVPKPVFQQNGTGSFQLTKNSRIDVSGGANAIGADLAADIRPPTGFALPVTPSAARPGDISIQLDRSVVVPGDRLHEGYLLQVQPSGVVLRAPTAHGLFNGIQTIEQLLPPMIASSTWREGPWTMPATNIVDYPRYQYRGFMLDIARHFEPPWVVKRLIAEAAHYKLNVFHLHLSDDQGFRIVINGFPRLTAIGGQGSVGTDGRTMDPGGHWTQAQYRSVVAFAAARFITVMPEVDSPGHNNAIVMSEYNDTSNPRLNGKPQDINCTVNNPPQWNYTEDVGYSALCPESENTWTILRAIIDQLTALSPGPYYDLGGDEVPTSVLSQQRYASLVNKESGIVAGDGKTVMGWADISSEGTNPPAGSIAEYWNPASGSDPGTETATDAVAKGMKIVMAPANHTYLDQKYAPNVPTDLGLSWACPNGCDVDQFYNWDPATYVNGVTDNNVIGVECALWGETVRNINEDEYMAFPRLLAIAELGWSPQVTRTATSPAYKNFLSRLGAQGARLQAAGVNFYPTPEVNWPLSLAPASPVAMGAHQITGDLATLSAPNVPTGDVQATIIWGDGQTSPGQVEGTGPGHNEVGGVYEIWGSHTYAGTPPQFITIRVHAPGKSPVSATVPLPPGGQASGPGTGSAKSPHLV
jgi:hexosaminidase